MRSTRTMSLRSPRRSSRASSSAAHSSDAATPMMSSWSGVIGDTKVAGFQPRVAEQQSSKFTAQRRAWNPHDVWLLIPTSSSSMTTVGSTRRAPTSHQGMWVKWTVRRSGRSWASQVPTSERW